MQSLPPVPSNSGDLTGLGEGGTDAEYDTGISTEDEGPLQTAPSSPPVRRESLNLPSSTPIDSIEIHNILGQRITSIQGSNQIDVSNLTNGTYTCKIYLEDGSVIIKRFVKQ